MNSETKNVEIPSIPGSVDIHLGNGVTLRVVPATEHFPASVSVAKRDEFGNATPLAMLEVEADGLVKALVLGSGKLMPGIFTPSDPSAWAWKDGSYRKSR